MPGEPGRGQPNRISENGVSSAVGRPSWLVTTLAGIHVVLGAIWVVFAGFVVFLLAAIGIGKGANANEVLLVSLGLCFVSALPGVGLVFVGYGLFRRRRWSRIGALILGGFSALTASQMLVVGFWEGEVEAVMFAAIPGGYAMFAYCILLHKRYAAEFT